MKLTRILTSLAGGGLALALTLALVTSAQEPPPNPPTPEDPATPAEQATPPPTPTPPETVEPADSSELRELGAVTDDDEAIVMTERAARRERFRSARERVQIGSDVLLERGQVATEAVAIMGNNVIDGEVRNDAVAVMGDITVNGYVGGGAVAVLGNGTVNGQVDGDLVVVLGKVTLGPEAWVQGEVVSIGSKVSRAPGARVGGGTQEIALLGNTDINVDWLKAWIRHCLLMGRPLWFGEHLGWAWMVAGTALVLYMFIALIMPGAVNRCASTFEARPGLSVVAAILTVLITPLAFIVLSFTVLGAFLLIFLMFFVSIFGKVVFLAWLGRRFASKPITMAPVLAVLLGGLLTTVIYLIPIAGFAFQKLAGFLGTGVVVYTVILAMQSGRGKASPSGTSSPAPTPTGSSAGTAASAASNVTAGSVSTERPIGEPPPLDPSGATAPAEPPPPLSAAATPPRSGKVRDLSTLPRAGFWARLGATLLDVILVAIVVNMLDSSFLDVDDMFPLIAAVYFIVLWALKGTTIGGIVFGLKVVRLDDRPVDWSVAIVRGLGAFLSLFAIGLGFIWVAFDPERQSWHDKIAGTTIVHMPKGVSLI
ncbi:RDD family protein [Synoicihabitans lomoniglobus]|uniref:RDD family protein n=1 Tax=Synoicihabitans lomoniglobus TaxID=2909285 RepID=A0AAE9ZV42_9BACT|nr:RDD family protein [Opitutaceae bacterium LMO-M01]WED63926.1 RDD family protein [Opitutaceae bacterium LMO-M01]